ncbi:MAG TPA: polysaccharide biosynthesis/export family protein [Nevskiaceae bacterium]|nr:polysaccharide biosynthesis/export family protein [Nevskiaceae bacterium]
MLSIAVRRLLLVLCLLSLGGCADILPGLNINVAQSSSDAYRVVKDSSGHYRAVPVQPGSKLPPYRILPITAQLVVAEAEQRAHARIANDILPAVEPGMPPPEYRIGPGDVVSITVWDHPELTAPAGTQTQNTTFDGQLVASDGDMYYPFVGKFRAAGMTAAQLRGFLVDHLKTFIQDPQVGVRIVSYQADRVEVTGEVLKPGTITLDNTTKGVLQAIDEAGGLAPNASHRRAILIRHGKRYVIDLAGLLSGNRVVPNPVLEPGDSIHIPDNSGDQVFMLGAVDKQQPVVIQQNSLTLLQAITQAGGLSQTTANDSGVLVFRMAKREGQPATVFTLDLSRAANVFLAGQFDLDPRDVVYVKSTGFSKYNAVIAQILPTVTTVFELAELKTLTK